MLKRRDRFFSVLLAFLMLLNTTSISIGSEIENIFDGTQSSWAETELKQAHSLKLTYPDVMNNYRKNITREEFSSLAVKLYEAFTDKKATATKNPFLDTNNEEVLKAYNLGIVKGISNTEFAPKKDITRQEICVMIYRALAVSLDNLIEDKILELPFSDKDRVASWAIKEVRFAYTYSIMKGMGNNKLEPLLNTTREQAIVLLKRTYASFSDDENLDIILNPEGSMGVIETYKPDLKVIDPKLNYGNMKEPNLFFPDYDERLDLYVATSEIKPNSAAKRIENTVAIASTNILPIVILKPILPIEKLDPIILPVFTTSTRWTSSSYGAFIDVAGNTNRWFSYNLKNASNAKKIVWQVSTTPYKGFKDGWKTPQGLVGSGEASLSSKEFTIDFKNLTVKNDSKFQLVNSQLQLQGKYKPIPQEKIVYYVRAFPIDGLGNPIGDPGDGLAVTYGIRTTNYFSDKKIEASFQLWTPIASDIVNGPEFFDLPELRNEVTVLPNSAERFFHFKGIDASYKKIIIQVSTKPFSNSDGRWPNTKDLIYQEEYDIPIANIYQNYPNSIYLDFSKFAKPASEMKQGDFTNYYIRGVALKESNEPGFYDDYYSTSTKIVYRLANPVNYFSDSPYTKTVILDKALPDLSIKNYVPTKWQDSNYLNRYYVYRIPKWNEINCKFKNSSTGYILYPYSHYAMNPNLGVSSPEQYENEIISKVLNVGTKVYFPPPKEENKEWYQQLYDGIVNFFKDTAKIFEKIYTQIQAAYTNLKNSAIMFVVNLCPVDALKGPFKVALEAWVNYGLMSIGIPPSLPTFDELTDASMDYFAQVVLTEAGIPENEWTKDLVRDVAEGMAEEIDKASSYPDANPIDSPFLKLDPEYLYRPAYVNIEAKNSRNVPSIPGTFDLHVHFEMDYTNYYLNLIVETNYSIGSAPALEAESKYREHFVRGLNGYIVNYNLGDKAMYDVFHPKFSVKVPQLMPGEMTNIRVYLEPVTLANKSAQTIARYPDAEGLRSIDFENMYFNNGRTSEYTRFKLYGHFPTAREYLLMSDNMLYLDPKTGYFFKDENYAKTGDILEEPVSKAWTK